MEDAHVDEWIRAHIEDVPSQAREFCGDVFRDKRMLDVGCGDMLSALGLLNLGLSSLVGVDIDPGVAGWKETMANRVAANGHALPDGYADRLDYFSYDGENLPFDSASFDIVFSWSAFEHISEPGTVLRQMNRVLRDDGFAFVQVYPGIRPTRAAISSNGSSSPLSTCFRKIAGSSAAFRTMSTIIRKPTQTSS